MRTVNYCIFPIQIFAETGRHSLLFFHFGTFVSSRSNQSTNNTPFYLSSRQKFTEPFAWEVVDSRLLICF